MTATAGDNIIDSRDLIERMEELEARDVLDDEEREEIAAIKEIEDCVEDWQYGATLILDDHFVEYAQELAEDIGAIDPNAAWPATYIDWNAAADALRMDYTAVELQGYTYWTR